MEIHSDYRYIRLSLAKGAVASLFGFFEFPDADAEKEALRHDVSVGIDANYIDSRGNKYDTPCIDHVALTSQPNIPELGPWQLVAKTEDGKSVYRKELLFTGSFYVPSKSSPLVVTPDGIEKLSLNVDKFQTNGVGIPLQLTHTKDGEQLGKLLSVEIETTEKKGEVSPDLLSLAKHSPIKLSRSNVKMLDTFGGLLGLSFEDGATDEDKEKAIADAIKAMKESKKEDDTELSKDDTKTEEELDEKEEDEEEKKEEKKPINLSRNSWPKAIVSNVVDARKLKLDAAVKSACLTPAQRDVAANKYATEDCVRIDLSRGDESANDFDNFMEVVAAGAGAAWKSNGRKETSEDAEKLNLSRKTEASPMQQAREARNKKK